MEYFPYNWVGNFIPSMTFMQPGVMGFSPNPWDQRQDFPSFNRNFQNAGGAGF